MKALTFKRCGKSPEIGFADVPRPTLKADELLIEVHAASMNAIDNVVPTTEFAAAPLAQGRSKGKGLVQMR